MHHCDKAAPCTSNARSAYLFGFGGLGGLLLTGLGVGLSLLQKRLGDENVMSRRNGTVCVRNMRCQ